VWVKWSGQRGNESESPTFWHAASDALSLSSDHLHRISRPMVSNETPSTISGMMSGGECEWCS
jgi:hypothetical protein